MPSKRSGSIAKLSWGLFLATIVLLPFRYRFLLLSRPVEPVWKDYTDFLVFAADIALLLCVVLWLFNQRRNLRKIKMGPAFLALPLIGLVAISLLATITSVDPGLSLYHTVRLAILFGFYLYVVNNVSSLQQLTAPLAAMVGIQTVVAIAQVLTQGSIGLQALGEYELDPAWNGVSVVWTESVRSLRGYGLSDHPNILGGILAFGLLLLAVSQITKPSKWANMVLATMAAGSVALLLTFSRSAWLGALVGIGWIAWQLLRVKNGETTRRALGLAALVLVVVSPFIWQNLELLGVRLGAGGSFQELPAEMGSFGERRVLIGAANQLFSTNALMGVGLGASPIAFRDAFPDFAVSYQPAHFVLLNAAVETGLLGGLIYAVLLAAPLAALYFNRGLRMTPELMAATAVLLALIVIGFFDYYPWLLVPGRLLQYLGWGLWARAYMDTNSKARKRG